MKLFHFLFGAKHGDFQRHRVCTLFNHTEWPHLEVHSHGSRRKIKQVLLMHADQHWAFDISEDWEMILGWTQLSVPEHQVAERLRTIGYQEFQDANKNNLSTKSEKISKSNTRIEDSE